ncbi:MAG: hypothetical protein ABIP48_24600 [Planctomycetota bacterium]
MPDSRSVMRDTTREAAAVYYASLRRLQPEDRVRRSLELSDQMRAVMEAGVRHRHPDYDEEAVRLAFLRLWLGEALPRAVCSNRGGKRMTDSGMRFRWLVESLDRAGIAYMVSGSLASTFHGEHRATNDVDVIISPTESQLKTLLESFGEEIYVSPAVAQEAFHHRSMFNVIDPMSGFKADLIIRKERAFSIEEFNRRRRVEILGVTLYIVSAEDTILSKLEWSKAGGSDQQFRDALGVACVQLETLDRDYLQRWSHELNVHDLLEELLREARRQLSSE